MLLFNFIIVTSFFPIPYSEIDINDSPYSSKIYLEENDEYFELNKMNETEKNRKIKENKDDKTIILQNIIFSL
ncbi:MAG: hypothetical protein ACPKQO_11170 [Nitrososphaeraceae archaeon]